MPLPAPDIEEGMRLSDEERHEIVTLAKSLYTISEDLKVLDTCDRVMGRSQDLLSLAQAFSTWAEMLSQSKADQFLIQVGLKKAN